MARQIQLRRGTTAEHATFTGAAGEITVDTDKKAPVVHDGSTAGGIPVARDSLAAHLAGTETFTGVKTFSANNVHTGLEKFQALIEKWNIVADNLASGDNNFNILTSAIWYWTTAGDTNATLNFRGDGSNSLDSLLAVGESVTVAALIVHTGTAYLINALKVDGSSVTPKWVDGTAPSAGSINATDVYTFTILKTASATFTILAQRVKWDEV